MSVEHQHVTAAVGHTLAACIVLPFPAAVYWGSADTRRCPSQLSTPVHPHKFVLIARCVLPAAGGFVGVHGSRVWPAVGDLIAHPAHEHASTLGQEVQPSHGQEVGQPPTAAAAAAAGRQCSPSWHYCQAAQSSLQPGQLTKHTAAATQACCLAAVCWQKFSSRTFVACASYAPRFQHNTPGTLATRLIELAMSHKPCACKAGATSRRCQKQSE